MVPWAHPSLHPKRHLDRFSLFGTVHAPYEQTDTCTDRPHFKGNNISRAVLCFAMRPIDKFVFRSHVRIYANERTAFLFAIVLACRQCFDTVVWVWYGMVNVDLYSAIITKVSNALNTPVSGEKPGFQTLSKGLVVLLCSEIVRQSSRPWGCAQRMLGVRQWLADVGGPPSVAVQLGVRNSIRSVKME